MLSRKVEKYQAGKFVLLYLNGKINETSKLLFHKIERFAK